MGLAPRSRREEGSAPRRVSQVSGEQGSWQQ